MTNPKPTDAEMHAQLLDLTKGLLERVERLSEAIERRERKHKAEMARVREVAELLVLDNLTPWEQS